ncbi:MAG: hypothetical protein PHU46_01960 [Rhodocyclaceae bacterium]|nr:hypothetical protein [Rhodocyclaceae bacterium]
MKYNFPPQRRKERKGPQRQLFGEESGDPWLSVLEFLCAALRLGAFAVRF